MKHRHSNFILSRTANHRQHLLQGLTEQFLEHGFVVTTQAKGKALREFIEPLVTLAKGEPTLHQRRKLLAVLPDVKDIAALMQIAQEYKERSGGYVRLTKIFSSRHDGARLVRVDWVK